MKNRNSGGKFIKGHKHTKVALLKNKLKHLGKKHTVKTKLKISKNNARYWFNKPGNQRGKKHWNWRGGISTENNRLRNSFEYKLWRRAVFQRDNYTCIWCGERGSRLNADHIKPVAFYPELRFAIDNGRTLCENCHKKTPTFQNRWYKKHDWRSLSIKARRRIIKAFLKRRSHGMEKMSMRTALGRFTRPNNQRVCLQV